MTHMDVTMLDSVCGITLLSLCRLNVQDLHHSKRCLIKRYLIILTLILHKDAE